MSQIRTSSLALAILFSPLLVMSLSGCGDSNPQAGFDPVASVHVANWLPSGHKATARVDITGCADCHGQDLQGGISKVSCTRCHLGSATSVHPVLWGDFAYAFHAGYVKTNPTGSNSCAVAVCHGTDLLGVGNAPSCAINCHMAGTAQAPQRHAWIGTTTGENIDGHREYFDDNVRDYSPCRNIACHGGAGTIPPITPPGVFLSGPACLSCHGSGNPLPPEQL